MASHFLCKALLIIIVFISSQLFFSPILVHSIEFEVGGSKGWVVPNSKNPQSYNQWASKNRFQVGDLIRFRYDKDSVMVVSDSEYEKCFCPHPIFFSNNGDTILKLDHPGLFYFISGVQGHCERGQKMIIKILAPESPPLLSPNTTATPPHPTRNAAVPMAGISSNIIMLQFVMSFVGFVIIVSSIQC